MALFNSFTFGDVDSEDYGVYISGDSVYDSPARSVDLVQVPGRNGALALDNGYYENIEVTYPAGSFGTSQTEWREKMLGIRNALAAQRGYQKLIDTYHPEHYRLGMFFAGISATPVQYNRAGQFPIRFNCKPQRFLISGDTPVEFTAEGQEEVYGPSSIASFEAEEGAEIRQLEVDLEPVQDLNGYDNPWPAGGGKNLYDKDSPNIIQDAAIDPSTGSIDYGMSEYSVSDFIPVESGYSYVISGNGYANDSFGGCYDANKQLISNIGALEFVPYAVIPNGTKYIRVDKDNGVTNFQIEKGTSATSFAPYSNICPISGHTEVNVTRTGKNLSSMGSASTNAIGSVNVSYNGKIAELNGGVTYTLSFTILTAAIGTSYGNRLGVYINDVTVAARYELNETGEKTLTLTPQNDCFISFWCGGVYPSNTKIIDNVQVELGSTATTYEPYAGQTYPIPLGQTVYGGTLDVVSGVLTVTKVYDDLSALTWQTRVTGTNNKSISASVTNYFLTKSVSIIAENYAYNGKAAGYIQAPDNERIGLYSYNPLSATDTTTARTIYLVISNGQTPSGKLVYELAAPTTVQLTPTQVSTLLGQNNIWSDSGEVEVKVASPVDLTNPTNFPAKPLIRVYGNGSVQVGDTIATVQNNADGYVDIDCESMNCYDTTGGRNADVSFSGNDFPELASGDNGILLTGPSRVEITPRWWEL